MREITTLQAGATIGFYGRAAGPARRRAAVWYTRLNVLADDVRECGW